MNESRSTSTAPLTPSRLQWRGPRVFPAAAEGRRAGLKRHWLLSSVTAILAACAGAPRCASTARAQQNADAATDSAAADSSSKACAAKTPPPWAASSAPPADTPTRPLVVPVPIEDPSGRALSHFHAALRAAAAKRGQARIMFYGASHTAADIYTEVIRERLQKRFGEAGTGFALPARPRPHYRSAGLSFETSRGWQGVQVRAREPLAGRYGVAGTYVRATPRHRARSAFTTRARAGLTGDASDFELYYLKQPRGGRLRVTIDGKSYRISTRAAHVKPAYRRFAATDGPHHVELSTLGDGFVRLFGMSIERDVPGVVVDTLGIPGARAASQLLWKQPLYARQIARRKPDLIVLAYGTNEAGDDDQPIEEYAADLRHVLKRLHAAAPRASCLLVGPSDRPRQTETGTYEDRPRTAQIVETQRRVSAEFGCGFFDVVALMGGPMSMVRWAAADPALGTPDHVHFTRRGYETLGRVLYDALLTGYHADKPERRRVAGPGRGRPSATRRGGRDAELQTASASPPAPDQGRPAGATPQ